MAKLGINTGSNPNDGQGDPLRIAMGKINSNFTEIYNTFGDGFDIVSYASTAGISTVARNLTGSPIINVSGILNTGITTTEQLEVRDIRSTGVITATQFVGDGSQLENVVSTNAGVEVLDENVRKGVAKELNFGEGLFCSGPDGVGRVTIAITTSIVSGGGTGGSTPLEFRNQNTILGEYSKINFGNNLFASVNPVTGVVTVTTSGVSTFNTVVVGGSNTSLVVNGNARITGILTIGTSSLTLDGNNNQIKIGTGVTIKETGGASFSEGINIVGVVTATSFKGSGSQLTGVITSLTGYATTSYVTSAIAGITSTIGVASTITSAQISNWDTSYSWGNHATASYATTSYVNNALSGYAPIFYVNQQIGLNTFTGAATSITSGQISNWNTSYSWGNHATFGYATVGYVSNASVAFASTSGIATVAKGLTGSPDISVGRIIAGVTSSIVPFLWPTFASLPDYSLYHGAVAHAHDTEKLYYAHTRWVELVNTEADGTVGTGTENYNIGVITATRFQSTSAGTPTIGAATTISLETITVAISTDATVGRKLTVAGLTTVSSGGLNVTGIVTATSFSGNGSQLTGVITSLVGYATQGYVTNALVGYATQGYVTNALVGYATQGYVTNSLVGYATQGYVTNALVGYATTGSIVGFITSGALTSYATTSYVNSLTLDQLSDVNVGAPSTGQVLKWSGSQWQASADLTASGAGIGLSDLSVTINPSGINSLTYNNNTGVFLFTPTNLVGYATQGYVTNALVGYATQGYVTNALVGYATQGYVTNALVGYATQGYVTTQIGLNTFTGAATSITAGQISNWNTSYSWGNHATVGYLTNVNITAGSNITVLETSEGNFIITSTSIAGAGGTWAVNSAGIHTSKNVGIGTTLSSSALTVEGDGRFSGVVTATRFQSTSTGTPTIGAATTISLETITVAISTDATVGRKLTVAGLTTVSSGGLNVTGIITASSFVGNLAGNVTGNATGLSGTPNITVGTIGATSLNASGVSTFAGITTVTGSTLFVKQLNSSGVVTASSFSGSASGLTGIPAGQLTGALPALDGSALTGIVASGTGIVIREEGTTIGTAGTINFVGVGVTATFSSGIATVSITASGGNIAGIDTSGTSTFTNLNVTGVSTLGNTIVGGATTQLLVNGNTRITGILTIGTGSITLDGSNNQLKVGTGVTISSSGVTVAGVVTATSFSGALTGNVTGNATGLSGTPNINVGTVTGNLTGNVTGNVTGNATGLSGTPNITVGTIAATSLNASGVVTATQFQSTSAGTPTIGAAATISLETITVAISTDATIGRKLTVAGLTTVSSGGLNVTGVATAITFVGALTGNVAGNATGLSGTPNITVGTIGATSLTASGVVTATTFFGSLTGNVTGNATGLAGTPNITVGTIGATSLNVSGVSTFSYIHNTGITSTKDLIVYGTGNGDASISTISLRSRNNFIDFDAAIPNTSPPQQFGIKFQGTTILGGSYAFPSGSIFLNNYNGTTALSISDNGLQLAGITTVTGNTLFAKQVNVSGVVTATSFVGDGSGLTNLPSSGIAGINTSGTSTFNNLNVTGVSTFAGITTVTGNTLFAKQVNVSGVSTFNNSATFKGNTTVTDSNFLIVSESPGSPNNAHLGFDRISFYSDGNTISNFQWHNASSFTLRGYGGFNLNLVNRSTGSGGSDTVLLNVNASGDTTIAGNLNISGVSTFAGITTVTGPTLFAKQLNVSGVVTASSFVGDGSGLTNLPGGGGGIAGINTSGTSTFTHINATGIITSTSFRTNTTTGNGSDVGFAIKYYITSNGPSSYRFAGPGVLNSTDNPTLYLHRGFTYIFENSTGGSHPLAIRYSSGGTGYGSTYLSGSQTGTQIFTVPFDAPSTLVYQCIYHGGMVGTLNIVT